MSKKNLGSSIDDFMKKENIFEEAQAQAIKEVVAWQLAKAMKKKKISKARMAVLLKTSRSQVDRILDPKRDITLSSLQRAAALVGQRVVIQLVLRSGSSALPLPAHSFAKNANEWGTRPPKLDDSITWIRIPEGEVRL